MAGAAAQHKRNAFPGSATSPAYPYFSAAKSARRCKVIILYSDRRSLSFGSFILLSLSICERCTKVCHRMKENTTMLSIGGVRMKNYFIGELNLAQERPDEEICEPTATSRLENGRQPPSEQAPRPSQPSAKRPWLRSVPIRPGCDAID